MANETDNNQSQTDLEIINDEAKEPLEDTSEDIKVLSEDDEVKEVKEEIEEEPKSELELLEDEDKKEIKEEDDEDTLKVSTRPTVKEITAKFPDFFKTFPDMRIALFREKEFSTIYPTVEDAREASDMSEEYEDLQNAVYSGTTEGVITLLNAMKEGKEESISSFAENFPKALAKMNPDLYYEAIALPLLENIVKKAFIYGTNNGKENLTNAAKVLSKWLFDDNEYKIATTNATQIKKKETSPDQKKLEDSKNASLAEKHNTLKKNVDTRCQKSLLKAIDEGLDPNKVFDDWKKDQIIKEVLKGIDDHLSNDENHMKSIGKLWKKAFNAGFEGDWEARIITAYLARAKSIMPAIRARVRAVASGEKIEKTNKLKETAKLDSSRKEIQRSGKAPSMPNGKTSTPSAKAVDWSKTSDMDFLSDNVVMKGK